MPQPQKTLTINAELVDRLSELATSLDRSREELATRAIDQFIEMQAWHLDTDVTEPATQTI